MIWLLAGPDEFRIKQRLNKIIGDQKDNTTIFEHNFDIQKIKSQIQTLPFFTERQIIILNNFLKTKDKDIQKEFASFLPSVPTFTELVFIETELDERLSLLKQIRKLGKVELFGELKGPELTNWITEKIKENNGEIQRQLAEKLGLMIGPDLVRLENEIKKLVAYNPEITEEAVSGLVDQGFFDSIFSFMDALSEKNSKKGIGLLDKFIDNENNELYLLSMLGRQIRNLLIIKDLSTNNSEADIVKITKLHPFVVKKTLGQSRNFELSRLIELHETILGADEALKTSSIDPKIALTRLVYNFTK